jgi:solute carrier family 25 (mitochondrial S-adenosylmethionine transporter), member 26
VRVPTEVVKQRMQAGQHSSLAKAVSATYNETRGIAGFYRGYTTTILREVDEDTWCDPSKSD